MYINIIPGITDLFTGREKELKKLEECFEETNLFYIEGLSGIGKTSIMIKLANLINEKPEYKNNILWLECKEDWTLDTLLMEINEWLVSMGEKSIKEYLNEKPLKNEEKALYIIKNLNKKKYIIFIDNFHNIKDEHTKFFITIFKQYIRTSIIYIISQKALTIVSNMDILRIRIKELDIDDSLLFIKKVFKFYDFQEVYENNILIKIIEKSQGHPLLLKTFLILIISRAYTIKELIDEKIGYDAKKTIFSKLMNNLLADEKNLLEILSSSRINLSTADIKEIIKIENPLQILSLLEDKMFVEKDQNCRYFIHPLLKEYIWNNISENKKKTLHNILGEYFEKNPEIYSEAFYHLINGGNPEKAGEVFLKNMEKLYSLGYYEEIIEKLNILEKNTPLTEYMKITKADVLLIQGNCEESLAILGEMENKTNNKELLAEIYFSMANVYRNICKFSSAVSFYENSLNLFKKSGNTKKIIKVINQLSSIYKFMGQEKKLDEILQEFFDIIQTENNEISIIHFLIRQGIMLLQNKEFEKALDISEKCLTIAKKHGSFRFISSTLTNKGHALVELKRYDEAYRSFDDNLSLGKEKGDNFIIAISYQGLGIIFYEKGDLKKASEYLKKSIETFMFRGNKVYPIISEYYLALILSEEKNFDEAIDLYSKVMKKACEMPFKEFEIKAAIKLIQIRYKIKGSYPLKEEIIKLKKEIPESLINQKIEINLILADIYHKKNKMKEKEAVLQEALELSEKSHNYYGLTKTYYLMSKISDKNEETKKLLIKKACANLDKLRASEKRELSYLFNKSNKNIEKKYLIKTLNSKCIASLKEVEELRNREKEFDLFIDMPAKHAFEKNKGKIDIFRKTKLLSLLLLFITNSEKGFSCKEIHEAICEWKYEGDKSDAEVRKCISRVRKLIEPDKKIFKYILKHKEFFGERKKYYFNIKTNFCLIKKIDT